MFTFNSFHCLSIPMPRTLHSQTNRSSVEPQASATDAVKINWVFFDPHSPRDDVFPIDIPSELFSKPAWECTPLFVERLQTRFGLIIQGDYVTFYLVRFSPFVVVPVKLNYCSLSQTSLPTLLAWMDGLGASMI